MRPNPAQFAVEEGGSMLSLSTWGSSGSLSATNPCFLCRHLLEKHRKALVCDKPDVMWAEIQEIDYSWGQQDWCKLLLVCLICGIGFLCALGQGNHSPEHEWWGSLHTLSVFIKPVGSYCAGIDRPTYTWMWRKTETNLTDLLKISDTGRDNAIRWHAFLSANIQPRDVSSDIQKCTYSKDTFSPKSSLHLRLKSQKLFFEVGCPIVLWIWLSKCSFEQTVETFKRHQLPLFLLAFLHLYCYGVHTRTCT